MSEPVVFEAFSVDLGSHGYLKNGEVMWFTMDEGLARMEARLQREHFGGTANPIRVRVTVEVIEPDDGPQEAA